VNANLSEVSRPAELLFHLLRLVMRLLYPPRNGAINAVLRLGLLACCSCSLQDWSAQIGASPAIAPALLEVATTALPDEIVDKLHGVTLASTMGSPGYGWNVVSGSLSPDLRLDSSRGGITGAPTPASSFGFNTRVHDSLSPLQVPITRLGATVVAEASKSLPSRFFGMHVMDPYMKNPWPTVPVNALGKGARTLWSYIETSRGVFDWSRLDAYVHLSQTHGVKMMYAASGIPAWAAADVSTCSVPFVGAPPKCSGMVRNIRDWDDFVAALVTRYKGKITAYELWNEPNDSDSFAGTVADMVTLTRHFHDVVRALDTNAILISPSYTVGTALDTYFAAGGTRDVDVVGFHASPDSRGDPELIVRSWTSSVRAIMAKYGLATKPLWNTEASWGSVVTDPERQAAFIARYYLLSWFRGIGRTYWYAWDNSQLGTLHIPGQPPTKAAIAYQQVYNWMLGGTTPRCTSSGGYESDGDFIYTDSFYRCDFTNGHQIPVQVVWQTSSDSILTTTYTVPAQFTRCRNLDGKTFPVPANRLLHVGIKPILLE
jgi:hypothetical protein